MYIVEGFVRLMKWIVQSVVEVESSVQEVNYFKVGRDGDRKT